MRTKHFMLAACLWSSAAALAQTDNTPLQPIASLDVNRYMGTWYEIAKYPNRFQSQCVRNTSAQYQLQKDGSVQVTNRCISADGKPKEAIGAARQLGAADSPKLQVRFAPAWLSFLPQVWGDYWVIDLDAHYHLVAVSEPQREYLWVLSRTPKLEAKSYDALLKRLQQQGFDLKRIETSPQE